MSRCTIVTKKARTGAQTAAPSKPLSAADLLSRRWLHTTDEVLHVLSRVDEIRVFAQTAFSTPPLVIWTKHSHPDTLQMLKASVSASAGEGRKPVTHGWLVMINRGRPYVVGYDFYNGVLVAGPDQAITVHGAIRERLVNLFRGASAKRAGCRLL
jgi:hypothetical protein